MKHIKLFEQFITEEIAWAGASSTNHTKEENDALFAAVSSAKKVNEFNEFTEGLMKFDNNAFKAVMDFIHYLDEKQLNVFLAGLGKYPSVEKLSSNFKSEYNNGNVGSQLFNLGINGVSNGLIFTAWLVAGAKPTKTANSNLVAGRASYNVLDLSGVDHPFSLGKAIPASYQIKFVREMEAVGSIIEEIAANQSYNSEQADLYKAALSATQFADSTPSMDFSNGEVSEPLFRAVITFIESANNLLNSGKIEDPTLATNLSKSDFIKNGVTAVIRSINDEITSAERKTSGVVHVIFRSDAMNVTTKLAKVTGKSASDLYRQYGLFTKNSAFAINGLEFKVREQA